MEVTNRFKGLDLIGRVPEELWMEIHDTVEEARTSRRKRNAIMPKKKKKKPLPPPGFSGATGQNGCLRRPYK